jgi:hypothetical protein
MINIQIYEMDYSVSPGGVNCWEATIATVDGYGESKCYSNFRTAGHALDHMLSIYPDKELNVNVKSLAAYYKLEERREKLERENAIGRKRVMDYKNKAKATDLITDFHHDPC